MITELRHRPSLVAVTVWLSVTCRLSGAVLWLSLGAADQPALTPDGQVLESMADVSVTVHQPEGTLLGTADLSGLDRAGPGHFIGVIHVGQVGAQSVRLRAHSPATEMQAELGEQQVWEEDFSPSVDPAYVVSVSELVWYSSYTIDLGITGHGSVSGQLAEYEFGAVASLTALPEPGWEFIAWTSDIFAGEETSNPLTMSVDADAAVLVVFRLQVTDSWLLLHFGTTVVSLDADPDEDGFTTRDEYENGTDPLADEQVPFTLSFKEGWNMVSLPVQPPPETTLTDLFGAFAPQGVWTWDAFRGAYEQNAVPRAGRGYWVSATADADDVVVWGQPVVDPALRLYSGWNCVGPASAFLIAPGTDVLVGWSWNATRQTYARLGDQEVMLPGIGYWLYTASDMVLSPAE